MKLNHTLFLFVLSSTTAMAQNAIQIDQIEMVEQKCKVLSKPTPNVRKSHSEHSIYDVLSGKMNLAEVNEIEMRQYSIEDKYKCYRDEIEKLEVGFGGADGANAISDIKDVCYNVAVKTDAIICFEQTLEATKKDLMANTEQDQSNDELVTDEQQIIDLIHSNRKSFSSLRAWSFERNIQKLIKSGVITAKGELVLTDYECFLHENQELRLGCWLTALNSLI